MRLIKYSILFLAIMFNSQTINAATVKINSIDAAVGLPGDSVGIFAKVDLVNGEQTDIAALIKIRVKNPGSLKVGKFVSSNPSNIEFSGLNPIGLGTYIFDEKATVGAITNVGLEFDFIILDLAGDGSQDVLVTIPGTIAVKVIPIPGAAFLFASGLLYLCRLKTRTKIV